VRIALSLNPKSGTLTTSLLGRDLASLWGQTMLSTWLTSRVHSLGRAIPGRVSHPLATAAAHLFWPWACSLCGVAALDDDAGPLCRGCTEAIAAERLESYCRLCGMPTTQQPEAACPACGSRPRDYTAIAVAGAHQTALRQAILQWKFGRCPGLDLLLGDMMVEVLSHQSWRVEIGGLVPIPQCWTRWLQRQRFPVGELAQRVGTRAGIPVWPILKARRHRPQVGLDYKTRQSNVRGVFFSRRGIDLGGASVCLVDDVTTTGATLAAAAKALRQAGAARVYALAIAKMVG
jgi:predicted amidophosphoribosyltransferase